MYTYGIYPYWFRWKYRKYPNVHLRKWHFPLLGDYIQYIRDVESGKVHYDHLKQNHEELSQYDIRIEFEGSEPIFKITSPEAHRQFDELHPHKIDRVLEDLGFGKLCLDAFFNIRCTKDFKHRRQVFMKLMTLNSSSKYIPTMIDCFKKISSTWIQGKSYEAIHEMNKFTFTVFVNVLFGTDMHHVATQLIDYEKENGQLEQYELRDFFIKLLKDFVVAWIHPISIFSPVINQYNLLPIFRRNQRNLKNFKDCLRKAMEQVADVNSICYQLMQVENLDKHIILEDIVMFLLAGTETTSHAISSIMFYLKKYPDVLAKLSRELKQH